MVLFSTSPAMRRQINPSRDARLHPSFANYDAHGKSKKKKKKKFLPPTKGGGAPIGAPSMSAQRRQVCANSCTLFCCAAAAHIVSRSPFGAPPRHSPGRTHPPLAELQFPRFLRPGSTGVARCRLSRSFTEPLGDRPPCRRSGGPSRPGAVCETVRAIPVTARLDLSACDYQLKLWQNPPYLILSAPVPV